MVIKLVRFNLITIFNNHKFMKTKYNFDKQKQNSFIKKI